MAEETIEVPAVAPEATPPEAPPETPEQPPRSYSQKEVDEIVGKVKDNAARKRAELRRDLETFKRMAFDKVPQREPPPPQTPPAQDQEPKLEQFGSYDEFVKATARYEATKHAKSVTEADRKEAEQKALRERQQAAVNAHLERQTKAMEKFEDYEDVAFRNPHMTEHMAGAIVESEMGPEVAYWLGKNQAESARIAKLSPVQQVKELGKIEARLEAPPAPEPKPSAAPEPITPVGGKATTASDEPSERDDIATWIRKRQKQVHGRRR